MANGADADPGLNINHSPEAAVRLATVTPLERLAAGITKIPGRRVMLPVLVEAAMSTPTAVVRKGIPPCQFNTKPLVSIKSLRD